MHCFNKSGAAYPFFHPQNRYFTFSLITNGTIWNSEVMAFLKKWNPQIIDISFDGPAHVHDCHRKTYDGLKTHATVLNTIKKIQEMGIQVRVLCTVTSTYPFVDKLFDYFQSQKINRVCFHIERGKKIQISFFFKLIHSYKKLIRLFLNSFFFDKNKTSFSMLEDDFLNAIFTRITKREKSLYRCTFGEDYAINPQGDIYPCDYVVNENNYKEGNIKTGEYKEFSVCDIDHINSCSSCCFKYLCGGICKIDTVNQKFECLFRKKIIQTMLKEYGVNIIRSHNDNFKIK